MSDKRKKHKFAAKREKRRLKQLADEGRLVNGIELPYGAVVADKSQLPNNSYSPLPDYYCDIEFTCKDCGRQDVWTAKQRKGYHEVAKGSLHARAVRCSDCRKKLAFQKELQRQRMIEVEQRKSAG